MRTIEDIYQKLKEDFGTKSGFVPGDGCDLAVRLWAAAAQIQSLEVQADWVLDQSFPQTATGIYLDRHAAMRGIARLPESKAVGILRFYVKDTPVEPLTIAAGTVCMTAEEKRFQTVEDAVLQPGELYAEATAEAMEGGSGGNAAAGSISILTACPVAITGCTNPEAFLGGSDAEADEALRTRVLESYQRLPNGANAAWYETTAMSHAGVAAASVIGKARGIGTVDVYITAENGLPGEELLTEVFADLQERREIAVDVQVKAPETAHVDVAVELSVEEDTDFAEVKAAAEKRLMSFFSGRLLAKPVLLAELGNLLYEVDGVKNYHILTPTADTAGNETVLPVLGTLTITEMEA